MFTNPLNRKYQTGGSAPTDDQKKDMQEFVTWIKSNVEGFKDKSEQEIAKSLSDMAKSDEGKKSVQDLYSRYQKSKKQKSKFADGGKFQDFICKHGRGGDIGCNCGGGTVVRAAEGIDDIPTPKDSTITSNGYVIYKPSVKEVAPNGESVVITYGHDPNGQWARRMEWANGGTSILGGYNNNGQWISEGDITYSPTSEFAKAFLSPRVRMSRYEDRPQSKQEGGELTRKQARILSRHNKGFNRGQFQLAMANADAALRANTDLRGRDLRQAKRRMVAGLNDKPLAISTTIESPILVAPSTGLVRSEVVEAPKANVAATQASSTLQHNASTNHRSNIARPEDFPMQEIVIPQISTNIPFGNGSRTAPSNNSTTVAIPEQEPTPVFINGRFVNASLPEDAPVYSAPRDSEGNIIIKDEGNGVYWTRDAEGRLQKHEPVRTATIATSAPRRNYSAITGQPLRNGQSTWDLFKQGGQIEKHQQENGVGRGKLNEYYPANETGRFGERVENIYTPDRNHVILITEPGKVSERRDSSFVFISPNSKSGNPAISRRYKTFDKFTDRGSFEGMRSLWENWKLHANKK